MKKKNVYILNTKDKKATELLIRLGMRSTFAKALLYLSHISECYSWEIEQGADLKQPEVSIAMEEFRRRGWISKQYLKPKGKGRPRYTYRMSKNIDDIIHEIIQEKLKEVSDIKSDITLLKQLVKGKIAG